MKLHLWQEEMRRRALTYIPVVITKAELEAADAEGAGGFMRLLDLYTRFTWKGWDVGFGRNRATRRALQFRRKAS